MTVSKISKKELRAKINAALIDLTTSLNLNSPSKKTLKQVKKTTALLAETFKDDLKKQQKKLVKSEKSIQKQKSGKVKPKKTKKVVTV